MSVGLAAILFVLMSDRVGMTWDHTEGAGPIEDSDHVGGAKTISARNGINARLSDPANYIAAEQTVDPSRRSEFVLEADRAKDLLEAIKAGETKWLPTLMDMDFSDVANNTYLECSARHLRQPCPYEIEYVIEYEEPGVGEIVFGRAVMEKIYSDDCEQYVKCTVEGNVGASVVLDPDISETFSRRKSQTDNYPDLSIEQLKEMLSIMEAAVAAMEQKGPDGQPDWEYRLELERSYLFLIRKRIEEKENQ